MKYILCIINWKDNNSEFRVGNYYLILSDEDYLYVRDDIGRTVKLYRNNWFESHFYEETEPLQIATLAIALEIGIELPVIISEY